MRSMRRRRIFRVIGAAMAVTGLLVVVWGLVTWQWGDPITGTYTRWQQRQLASEYARREDAFRLPPTRPGSKQQERARVRAAAQRLRLETAVGQPIGRIEVPRLGLKMTLVNGTDHATLRSGPGRDLRTFLPGEGRLIYIAGHRTTYLAPFAHIDALRAGDVVTLRMPYAVASYRVVGHVIVPASDVGRLRSRGYEELALQACHPRFSARQRYIVYARPLSFVPISG